MKRYLFFFFLFIFHCASGNDIRERVDSSGKYRFTWYEGDSSKTRFYKLKNGLSVIISVNKDLPRFYSYIAVKAGSKNDPRESTGLAHYLEHLLFKGTDKFGTTNYKKESEYLEVIESLYDLHNMTSEPDERKRIYRKIDSVSQIASGYAIANEYDKMMKSIGAKSTNAFTSFDQTVFVNDIPTNQLENWFKVEGERFRKPIFRLFHTELEAVYEEKNNLLNNDDNKVFETLMSSLFEKHTYGSQTTIGSVEHLKNPSLKNIRNFYDTYYVPNNMAIILAGNVDPEKAMMLADEYFGNYQSKTLPEFSFEPEKEIEIPKVNIVRGEESKSVSIAFRLPRKFTSDEPLFFLIDKILGDPTAGLIQQNLIKKQKVLYAWSGIYPLKDYTIFYLQGYPKANQTLDEVRDLLLQQIDSIKTGNFSKDLFKAIVFNKEIDDIKDLLSNQTRAMKLLDFFINQYDWNQVLNFDEKLKKITEKQLSEFTRNTLKKNYVVVNKECEKDLFIKNIEKPSITPIKLNRNSNSYFALTIMNDKSPVINPKFVDFKKDIQKKEIKKGFHVFLNRGRESRLFSLFYVYDIGRLNNATLPVAASLYELLGTDRRKADELAMEFYKMACTHDINVKDNQVIISLYGPHERMERAVAVLEHTLTNCLPDQNVLNEMIENILLERRNSKTDRDILAQALVNYACYGDENPFKWKISNKKLKTLQAVDLVNQIKELNKYPHEIYYYGPMHESNLSILLKKYHETPDSFKIVPPAKKFTALKQTQTTIYFTDFDIVQADIGWVRNTGIYKPEKQSSISLFNHYFGLDMASIVFQTIRESKALAYSCYGYIKTPDKENGDGFFHAYIGTQADKTDSAIFAMNDLLKNLPDVKSMFESSKSALKSSLESEWTIRENVLLQYINSKKMGLDYDLRKDIYKQLPDISFQHIQELYNESIKQKPFSIYVLGPKKQIPKSKLQQFGKVKTLSTYDILGY